MKIVWKSHFNVRRNGGDGARWKLRRETLLLVVAATAICIVWTSSSLVANADEPTSPVEQTSPLSVSGGYNLVKQDRGKKNPTRDVSVLLPHFVLHIGPPKTATTTIQCTLHQMSENLAKEDSYYFLGKTCPNLGHHMGNNETAIHGHHLLMGLNGGNSDTRGYIALKARMDYHRSQGNNIVYSNEGFANHMVDQNVTWELLQDLFVGWKVRIVIGYRHYFEWIRSLYYQQYLHDKKYMKNWPGQGRGVAHPSFLEYLDYHLLRWETNDLSVDGGHIARSFGHHLTLSTYHKFSPHFDDVQIFNLYDEGAVATNFVCNMLPNADSTCNLLKSSSTTQQHTGSPTATITTTTQMSSLVKRVSKSFDAQRIAEAAYINGYLDGSTSKEQVVSMIETKIQKGGLSRTSQFMACPSPELEERFLKASLAFEKEIVLLAQHGRLEMGDLKKINDNHIRQFQKAKSDGRFCEVNTEQVLGNNEWRTFLSEFGETKDATNKKR
jgi:hypothetical protein